MGRVGASGWTSVLALCALAGCGTPLEARHARHIIMFDGEGEPVDLTDRWGGGLLSYDTWEPEEYAQHVCSVVAGIRDHVATTGSREVVIFIHGGLNEQPETIARAVDLSAAVEADGAYPVFVNWQSNLVSSYFAHLLYVRQGRDWGQWGILVSPLYLVTDVARALFRLPIVIGHQIAEGLSSLTDLELADRTSARDATREIMREQAREAVRPAEQEAALFHVDIPRTAQGFGPIEPDRPEADDLDIGLLWLVTLPVKPVSMFIVDAAGKGSWDVMRRRVQLLFQREVDLAEFDPDSGQPPRVDREREGLLLFMAELEALQDELDLEISIVGHSMGTIVMNRLLFFSRMYGHFGEPHTESEQRLHLPRFRNIVYLAAACSIRDYQDSAFPYLQSDTDARVFHVVLHPDEELDEANAFDLAPRGSLLVWVDDFLASPVTMIERTAGRYDNFMGSLQNTPRAIRSQVFVRVLPRGRDGPGRQPAKHGEFSSPEDTAGGFHFWRPTSWWRYWADGQPVRAPEDGINREAFPRRNGEAPTP